jgi:hypothetical protein
MVKTTENALRKKAIKKMKRQREKLVPRNTAPKRK